MKKEIKPKEKISIKLAKKICEPYMTSVLYSCYRVAEYNGTFEEYCIKVNAELKGNNV